MVLEPLGEPPMESCGGKQDHPGNGYGPSNQKTHGYLLAVLFTFQKTVPYYGTKRKAPEGLPLPGPGVDFGLQGLRVSPEVGLYFPKMAFKSSSGVEMGMML